MYSQAVAILVTMDSWASPLDIDYDAFYKHHLNSENNAMGEFAKTNGSQNKSAEVPPVEPSTAIDLTFVYTSNIGCFAEIRKCETPPIEVQSANRGQPDPPTPTDSSISTSPNLRENGSEIVTGALESQTAFVNNDTEREYTLSDSDYCGEGVPVRIKTTSTLERILPRSAKRQVPKRFLLASRDSTARPDSEKLEELMKKVENVSSQGENIYACPLCSSIHTTKTSIQEHLMQHLAERTFDCHLCSRQFKLEQNLQKHIIWHSKRPFECHICHKVLSTVAGYKMHMESHSGITYECTICNRELLSISSLQGHMRIHIENKVYACPVCQKILKYKSTLNEHMRRHTGETPYECKVCHTKKATSQMMRTHMKKHR